MGGGGQNPISVQATEIPDWLKDATQKNITMADTIAGTPYANYNDADPSKRFADQNALQTRGTDYLKNMYDASGNYTAPGNANYNAAMTGVSNNAGANNMSIADPNSITSQQFGSQQAAQYMNPYQQQVINQGLQTINQQGSDQQAQMRRRQAARGAFGNNRTALEGSQLQQNTNNQVNQFLSGNLNQGFQNAQGQFNQDRASQMSADQQNIANFMKTGQLNQAAELQNRGLSNQAYGMMNQMQGAQNSEAMKNLLAGQSVGAANQQFAQQGEDYKYNDFLQQRDYPLRNLAIRQGALTGAAYPTTSTTYGPGNNNLAGNIGAFASLLGAGGMFGQGKGGSN
tara:strand:+ start:349 stop:1374 length:1026 start_codon:yes stop_codon:yes gene_type:complete